MDILLRLEESGLATLIRESEGLYGYPTILFLHTLGLGLLVGISTAIDLRILGVAPEVPLVEIEGLFLPMWIGFWINAVTGTLLFVAQPTKHFPNPAFALKLAFIALAVVNVKLIRSYIFRDPLLGKRPVQTNGKILAFTSVMLWLAAITAGRLMAYVKWRL